MLFIPFILYTRERGGLLRQVEHDAVEIISGCIDRTQRHLVCSRAAPHDFIIRISCPVAVISKDNRPIIDYLDLAELLARRSREGERVAIISIT